MLGLLLPQISHFFEHSIAFLYKNKEILDNIGGPFIHKPWIILNVDVGLPKSRSINCKNAKAFLKFGLTHDALKKRVGFHTTGYFFAQRLRRKNTQMLRGNFCVTSVCFFCVTSV